MINEDTVRRNFVLIYELLDEIMDYGYPQATATEQVKVYIFNTPAMVADNPIDFIASKMADAGLNLKSKTSVDASAVRKPVGVGTAKGQNEVFLDVLERITLTFDSAGDAPRVLNSEINFPQRPPIIDWNSSLWNAHSRLQPCSFLCSSPLH